MVTIKKSFVFVLLFVLLQIKIFSNEINENCSSIESLKIIDFFDSLKCSIKNIKDAKIKLKEIVYLIESNFELDLDIYKGCTYSLKMLSQFTIPNETKNNLTDILIELRDINNYFLKCANEKDEDGKEVPVEMIIGGIEIFVGTLLHFVPGCSNIGKIVIADGVRRGFNGLEKIDEENNK